MPISEAYPMVSLNAVKPRPVSHCIILEELHERALGLDMVGVKILSKDEIKEKEPYCKIENALYVPQAGVVDYKLVTESLANKFISMGGEIRFFQEIHDIESKGGIKSFSSKEETFNAEFLINCAGLYSDTVAALDNIETKLRIIPFRGEYFTINPSKSNYVNNMIYPIADPDLPFLGIHLTKTISGNIEAGPNAVIAFAKEGYEWKDVRLKELSRTVFYGGMWKLGKKYFKTGVSEMYRSLNKKVFLKEISSFIPDIVEKDLEPRISGVRAQAVDKDGNLLDDFIFEDGNQSLHVLNAPSPAATSSLAIGEYITRKILN